MTFPHALDVFAFLKYPWGAVQKVFVYEMLEKIVSLYYQTNDSAKNPADPSSGGKGDAYNTDSDWVTKMIHAIAAAGFFNTQRMVVQYLHNAYRLGQAPVQ